MSENIIAQDKAFDKTKSVTITKGDFLPFMETLWPESPKKEIFHGLAGEIVRELSQYTEANETAILANFLVYFGNVVGRKPYFRVGAGKHYTNEYVVLVGPTSKARKGEADNAVYEIFKCVESEWVLGRVISGLASGEGLIWAVRDEVKKIVKRKDKVEEIIVVDGIQDKRLLIIEQEFAGALKVMSRHGNTLSPVIRRAYDKDNLQIATKNSPARATGAHISIIGHITASELKNVLTETEQANGLANRFLWLCVKRSKILANGAVVPETLFNQLAVRVAKAVLFARNVGEMTRDEEAREIWEQAYPILTADKPGLLGAVTSRAEVHVLRLSMAYALLDLSKVIRKEHLLAALALEVYSEASCKHIFSGSNLSTTEAEILQALKEKPMTQSEIYHMFSGNLPAEVYKKALATLHTLGLIKYKKTSSGTGRPKVTWYLSKEYT